MKVGEINISKDNKNIIHSRLNTEVTKIRLLCLLKKFKDLIISWKLKVKKSNYYTRSQPNKNK